jgi:dihydroxyacetone kinase-like predicted kinase
MIAAGIGGDDLVTLFRGEQVAESESGAEISRLQSRFEDAEFELVEGGQPHYHYLISIE